MILLIGLLLVAPSSTADDPVVEVPVVEVPIVETPIVETPIVEVPVEAGTDEPIVEAPVETGTDEPPVEPPVEAGTDEPAVPSPASLPVLAPPPDLPEPERPPEAWGRSFEAQRTLAQGRGLAIGSAVLVAGGAGINVWRYSVVGDDDGPYIGATLAAWMVNSASIVLAGYAGRELGRYHAPARGAKAWLIGGAATLSLGITASIGLRLAVIPQGVNVLISGGDSLIQYPGYYVGLEACTIVVAMGAGMLGFGTNANRPRLALLPRVGGGGTGLALVGRF